ncbi:MAG: response regulator transcription factor [Proteobacteria bacterium]|nr:response regulator transcription factor [Pseudomonadota bacterium]
MVGTCGTGREALAALAPGRATLAIVDLVLPDVSGLELVRRLLSTLPALRILVVTAQERPAVVLEVFHAGVHGIVTKSTPLSELKEAARRVVAGRVYYCATTSSMLRMHSRKPPPEPLSPREQQIVRLVALGRSSKEIAAALSISPKTVANHRLRIGRKLQLGDIAGLTRYAMGRGWIGDNA